MHSPSNERIEKVAMNIFLILCAHLVSVAFVSVNSTAIEISSSPVTLPDPESLINYVSSAVFDVYKSAIIAVSKYCSEALEANFEGLETAENGINLGTRKMFDAIRTNVDAVFENFIKARASLSGIIKEAASLGQEEFERAQVVWNELKYGVRRLRRNIVSIRTNMKSSLAEIKENFVLESQEFNEAMNELYTKVLNKLCFEVRSATNMFQHALSLPSFQYYQIDLEDVYHNWIQLLQPVKQTPANLFKSARSFFNLVYNAIQTKFFLSGILLDNALWPSSSIIWGDAVQVKRFVDKTLRRLGRYTKESQAQIRSKFGKDSTALLEANRSLYNQIQSEVKQLIDLTEIPFKRMSSFNGGLLPFSSPSITNAAYHGRFRELLSYLQSKDYPVQVDIVECKNLMSFNSEHSQSDDFFNYLLNDAFKKSPPLEDPLLYTKLLQEERIQEITYIYKSLYDVVQNCANSAHEDGYKLPKIISMKVEDDALKYTLLMNDIRAYVCRSACFIEDHYSHSSAEYGKAVNGLCEDVKNKLDVAADYILDFIQRLDNYLDNHQSCLEKFTLWSNSGSSKTLATVIEDSKIGSAVGTTDLDTLLTDHSHNKAVDVKLTNALTSVSETDNIEDIGSSNLDLPSSLMNQDNCLTSTRLQKDDKASEVKIIDSNIVPLKTNVEYSNDETVTSSSLKTHQDIESNKVQKINHPLGYDILNADHVDLTTATLETTETAAINYENTSKDETLHEVSTSTLEMLQGDTTATSEIESVIDNQSPDTELSSYQIEKQHENFEKIGTISEMLKLNEGENLDEKLEVDQPIDNIELNSRTIDLADNAQDVVLGDEIAYEVTTQSDISSEENQPNNIEEVTSPKSVSDNEVVSSEEIQAGESTHYTSSKTDTYVENTFNSKISTLEDNSIMDLLEQGEIRDNTEILNGSSTISTPGIVIKDEEKDSTSHSFSRGSLSNHHNLEEQVQTTSKSENENSSLENSCTETSENMLNSISKKSKQALRSYRSNRKTTSSDIETIQDMSTTTVDGNLENEALCNKNQGILEEDIISTNSINSDMSHTAKLEKNSIISTADEDSPIGDSTYDSNIETSENMFDLISKKSKQAVKTYRSNRKTSSTDVETVQDMSTTTGTDIVVDRNLENEALSDKNQEILEEDIISTNSIINTVDRDSSIGDSTYDSNTETSENMLDLISKKSKQALKSYRSNRKTSSTDIENTQNMSTTTGTDIVVDRNLENETLSDKNQAMLEEDITPTNSISSDASTSIKMEENSIMNAVEDSDLIVDENTPNPLSNAVHQANSQITRSKRKSERNMKHKIEMEEQNISTEGGALQSHNLEDSSIITSDSNVHANNLMDERTSSICLDNFDKNEETIRSKSSFTASKRQNHNDAILNSNTFIDEHESDFASNIGTRSLISSNIDEDIKVTNSGDSCNDGQEVQLCDINQEETILGNYQSSIAVEENEILAASKDIELSTNPKELVIDNNIIDEKSSPLYENIEMESMRSAVDSSEVKSTVNKEISTMSSNSNMSKSESSKMSVDVQENEESSQLIGHTIDNIGNIEHSLSSNNDKSIVQSISEEGTVQSINKEGTRMSSLVDDHTIKDNIKTLSPFLHNLGSVDNMKENSKEDIGEIKSSIGQSESTSSNKDLNIIENFCTQDNTIGVIQSENSSSSSSTQSLDTYEYENTYTGMMDKHEETCVDDFPKKVEEFKEDSAIINSEREIELSETSHSARSIQFDNSIEATPGMGESSVIDNTLSELDSDISSAHKGAIGEVNTLNDMEVQRTELELDSRTQSTLTCDNQEHTSNKLEENIIHSLSEQNKVQIQKDLSISEESLDKNSIGIDSNMETLMDSKCDSAMAGMRAETLEDSPRTNMLNENIKHVEHNGIDEQMMSTTTDLSQGIAKDVSLINQGTSSELEELNKIATDKLATQEVIDTQLGNVENSIEHKNTFTEESSSSNIFTTVMKETTEKQEKSEQEIVKAADELSNKIEFDQTIKDELAGDSVVESNVDNADGTHPLYDMVWFPKKSWMPTVSPISTLKENDYGWFGWLVPGKQSPSHLTTLENPLNPPDEIDDSKPNTLTSIDEQCNVLESETIEKEQSSSYSSSKSETTQSSFTKTDTTSESVDVQATEILGLNGDCIENEKLVTETTTNSVNREESSLFKKWYNSFVNRK